MNLGAFLELEGGTAWVGFTASTGESYQNHEIMSWAFYEHASESTALGAAAGKVTGGVHSSPHSRIRRRIHSTLLQQAPLSHPSKYDRVE